ncbi:UNVERIFIED_CONTAM: Retrovirus-related Pol polyprotein from transposon RE1 [Sesamum radiatum]|uniref:Retrovirus-related Pol polyprotein from transposon RE1 n=1 Tax=Sesamum radiatum TaxID=300843 RepID=A0AAW2M2Q4_SESRA
MATGSGDLTEDRGATKSKVSELLELQSSDHPGMVLVSTPLNGRNYMAWSRAMRIALGAKMKLGFITENVLGLMRILMILRNGCVWIREIASISQGALSVTGYFTKLKQLWDELTYLAPVPHCNCEYSRTVVDYATSNQLMQFLMGLNDIYDHVRNQILVTDPLPNVNKAYSMILRVEKQRQINLSLHEGNEGAAMFTRAGAYKKDGQNKSDFKKRNFVDKKNLRCDNCNRSGHDRSTCFKIHGIPDWYKDLTEQRKKDGTGAEFSMSKLVTIELKLRLIPPLMQHQSLRFGATNHMCANSSLFHSLTLLKKPVSIRLPDNSSKTVTQSGTICLNDKISLAHVLYVPFFHNNLISVRCHFFLTIVDDYSRTTWTYLLKHKSQAVPLLETYLQMVQTQFDAKEPSTFSQAQQHAEWREAMNHELTALENNHTWELTTLPEGKRAIGSKWVYKVKLNPDGTVERYKARLVAKGYNQIEGLDINNAFLHGYLDEAVYMTPPEGYEAPSGMVCKLKRSLYGLKQASRQWNLEFTTQLTAYGFRQSANDHCLFTLSSAHGFLALLVYVDDVLITGTSDTLIQNVKSYLDRLFTIKDLGYVKYFLGLEVARSSDGLSVSQHKYICDIVTELHLQDAKTCTTPLPSGLKFSANEGALLQEPDRYRRLIGKFLYLVSQDRHFLCGSTT